MKTFHYNFKIKKIQENRGIISFIDKYRGIDNYIVKGNIIERLLHKDMNLKNKYSMIVISASGFEAAVFLCCGLFYQ